MDPVKLVNDFILRLKFRHRSCLGKNFNKKKIKVACFVCRRLQDIREWYQEGEVELIQGQKRLEMCVLQMILKDYKSLCLQTCVQYALLGCVAIQRYDMTR